MAIDPAGAKTKNDWTDGGQQQITKLYQTGAVEHGIIGESPIYWRLLLINKYMKMESTVVILSLQKMTKALQYLQLRAVSVQ
jgi:hypothetical protein